MQTSIRSLRALPPKQALALALAEKARRKRLLQQTEAARAAAAASNRPVRFREVPSLVLDRTHPLSDLLYKEARYKIYWGGRGSAKSWGIAEALIRKAASAPLRVLCVREFQNSMKESSHRILVDTIERLGLTSWFTWTQDSIKSHVGAEFIFKGIHGNENGIRSTEGVDICWAEEAHSISATSWRALRPTIRKAGSEIWISFNLISEDDATYQLFVANPRPRSIIHKINYDLNPFFSEELREEMEFDKAVDFHLYEHIWLGMPLKISNAVVLSGKYVVRDFDDALWQQSTVGPKYGADFGFAQDPNTLIRSFILEEWEPKVGRTVRRLYISHEAYGVGVEIDDMEEFYLSVPGAKEWPIKSDNSRPEFPSHFRARGFSMSAAEKWEGSVKDGIAFLRSFYEIVIHPRCKKTAEEARLWRYKTDPKTVDEHGQPLVLPILIDKHNHCWDAIRYSYDGYITRSGEVGLWHKIGQDAQMQQAA